MKEKIKQLRDLTQISFMECKRALVRNNGDIELAIQDLQKLGHKIQNKHKNKSTDHGVIQCYVHSGNKIGSMVEIKCETDFVAKNKEFNEFAKDIALHVAAMNPEYVNITDVSKEDIGRQRKLYEQEFAGNIKIKKGEVHFINEFGETVKGKVTNDHIKNFVDHKLQQWYMEKCLLEHVFVKDNSVTVKELLTNLVAKIGENCVISRIQRWEI